MQTYDLLMIAVFGGSILFGLWKGFAWQVASLASIIVSYMVARNFSGIVAGMIGGDPAWNRFLAMFILFFGCSLVIWILFGFVRGSIEQMHLRSFDRQLGTALGAVKGAVLCIIITLFSVSLLGENVCRTICTSRSGNYVAHALVRLHGIVPDEIRNFIGPYVDHFQREIIEHQNEVPATERPTPVPGGFSQLPPPGSQVTRLPAPWTGPAASGTLTNGGNESLGQLERAGHASSNGNSWNGVLREVDWGRAASEALDGFFNGSNQR